MGQQDTIKKKVRMTSQPHRASRQITAIVWMEF